MDAEDHRFRQTLLTEAVGKSAKSLQRMLGPKGNPTTESLFAMIKALQDAERSACVTLCEKL